MRDNLDDNEYRYYKQLSIDGSKANRIQEFMSDFEYDNNILLIEDNIADARLVEILLKESDLFNCKITHATTLGEGMQILKKDSDYAAILLDLSLPDSRGFETLEEFISQFPGNNIIVLTGFSDKNLGIKALQAGAQDFLVKGDFDADILSKTLRFSIERSSVLKRLEETQQIAHIGSWEFSENNGIFIASDETYRIFGFTPRKDTFGYREIQEINHPFFIFNQIHKEAIKLQPQIFRNDLKVRRKDQEYRNVHVQCAISKKSNGEYSFSGIIQDITERKLAEEKIIKSEARYRNIFSKSKDAIFISTFDGELIDFNKATSEITSLSAERLRSLSIQEIFGNKSFWKKIVQDLKLNISSKDIEFEFEDFNKKKAFCLLTASPLELENFEGFNCILRDITERKHAEELRKARDLAKQSDQLKEKFIASISHEMRTPMNAILGMSNLVLKTDDLNEEQRNYIQSIKQSSEVLLGIVNDILEVATLQNGKITFDNQDFDIQSLLANLVNVMTYKINEKDLNFELTIDETVPKWLKGDKIRLNQILYNLVGNAIKFTDSGTIKIKVELLNESTDSVHVKFTVQDTGIGIPKDKIGAIFDTFTRIRTKDRIFEGTGLGLSIAKDLVEYQGGKIWAESELGIGSTFFFDLILETATTQSPELNIPKPEETISPDHSFNLLLVEDHKMNQLVARKTLERQWKNINITIADNGEIAIDLLRENTYDIILMDIQMPIMDGYETTNHIRNKMRPEVARLPILAMTAHAHISKDGKFKEYGMDDFVLKPFDPKQLFKKICQYALTKKNI